MPRSVRPAAPWGALSRALCLLLVLGAPALAQRTVGAIRGRVVDSAGAGIPGVRVSLLGLGRTNVSAADGAFRFAAIPAGEHSLALVRIGLVPETRRVRVG